MGQRLAPSLAIAFMSKVEAPVMDLRPLLYLKIRMVKIHYMRGGQITSKSAENRLRLTQPTLPQFQLLRTHDRIFNGKRYRAVMMAMVGVLGLISNSTVLLAVRFNPMLRSSFSLMCLSHSIANIGVLLIFVFWTAPITFFEDEIAGDLPDKPFTTLKVMRWNVCVYSNLAIAFNRVIAIALPLRTSSVLTMKNTSIIVLFSWMLGFFRITPYFWSLHRAQKHNNKDFDVTVTILAQESKTSTRKTLEAFWINAQNPEMNGKDEKMNLQLVRLQKH
ncbi:hypothetical protein KIN20_021179 [Parelaphostrongylus tenuis]|uniref:G-protein coupled receptors family 1 profile domain-containing protein n=1 Tax=Parelaphostrongylus tenuis TaxID=148309 RepID=A0AAD5NAJ4_PARTN|nr:hypothetical protein KIN20_021179 [Parelaphostrongylus tenuis]